MPKNNISKTTENSFVPQLKEVYSTMVESGLSEVEMQSANYKLKIRRIRKPSVLENLEDKKESSQQFFEKEVVKNYEEVFGETINSPINGVFYIAPSPNSPPFVNEGDVVEAGKTVCIVEAMKVMNEIKTDKKCKILKVLCVNGTSVTTGTKLFSIQVL